MIELLASARDLLPSESVSTYKNVVAVVGALYLLKITIGVLRTLGSVLCAYFLGPRFGLCGVDVRNLGSWAVVTGASEGIGKGYALELARRGLNVVIMSRSREKLQKVADEIQEKYKREVLIISVDFTQGQVVYPRLAEKLKDLEIGVLVNNVGLSHAYAQFLLEASNQRLRDMVELNCQAMVQMTHMLLPAMVARRRGAIINISSTSSLFPVPLLGVYSATKIFVNYFSSALLHEYRSKGIIVQNVMPNFVSTAMTKMRRNFLVPSPLVYAHSAVATLGIQSSTFGCLPHAFIGFLYRTIPMLGMQISWHMLTYARKRYLKIMEKRKVKD